MKILCCYINIDNYLAINYYFSLSVNIAPCISDREVQIQCTSFPCKTATPADESLSNWNVHRWGNVLNFIPICFVTFADFLSHSLTGVTLEVSKRWQNKMHHYYRSLSLNVAGNTEKNVSTELYIYMTNIVVFFPF